MAPSPAACDVHAPAQLAAYALGATLWTPALMLVAGPFERVLAWLVPALPMAGMAATFGLVWALRFVLYAIGAARGWDYGYGINGVIVNRRLTLAAKARRIARDWFGVILGVIWVVVMLAAAAMALAS